MNEALVPDSWLTTSLGSVVDYGKTSKAEPSEIEDDDWVLELEDIEKGTSRVLARKTFSERQSLSTKNRFEAGDVLYAKLRPYLNKVVIADAPGFCTTEIVPLRGGVHLDQRFLFYWLKNPIFLGYVETESHGLNMPRLGTDTGRAAPFVLAPRSEQTRIADKLDAVLARADACRDRLDRIPDILKRFRQSVLRAAMSGQLSVDWRGGLEPEWAYERAADVCAKVQSGGTPKEGFTEDGIPFLKVYNIVDQKVAFEYKPQFIQPAIHKSSMAKSQTLPGDVLMNIVGPPLGKVAVVPGAHPEWNINQAITLFRPSSRISTGWLYIVLCSGKNIAHIVHETKGSAGQVNISLSQCRDFVFPVPSVEEQAEIVRRVGKLFTLADKLEARHAAARSHTDRLTPALLAKAFRGELVEQNPNDEPASALLARIAAERGSAGKPAGRGRRRAG